MKVARRYKFRASHSLPGVAGYDKPHEHDYTVEVVVSGDADEGGMVVDTAALDAIWHVTQPQLEGQDLNSVYAFPTTVENLAMRFQDIFSAVADCVVTTWEDDDRWGQAP